MTTVRQKEALLGLYSCEKWKSLELMLIVNNRVAKCEVCFAEIFISVCFAQPSEISFYNEGEVGYADVECLNKHVFP